MKSYVENRARQDRSTFGVGGVAISLNHETGNFL